MCLCCFVLIWSKTCCKWDGLTFNQTFLEIHWWLLPWLWDWLKFEDCFMLPKDTKCKGIGCCLGPDRKIEITVLCLWPLSVSQTGQTPAIVAFLSAGRQLPLHWACVCVEGKRVDFWENKAKIEGPLHWAHPACLLPLSVKYKVFIFWEPNNGTDSKCEQASKKQISLVIHKWKVFVLRETFSH